MKSLLRVSLKLFRNVFKNYKVADLDNDGKIETLQEEIEGLFSQFRQMSDKLDDTNSQLHNVLEDEENKQKSEWERLETLKLETEKRIENSQLRQTKAKANIEKNNKIKSKVDEFII